jgi:hypothetical protein
VEIRNQIENRVATRARPSHMAARSQTFSIVHLTKYFVREP